MIWLYGIVKGLIKGTEVVHDHYIGEIHSWQQGNKAILLEWFENIDWISKVENKSVTFRSTFSRDPQF